MNTIKDISQNIMSTWALSGDPNIGMYALQAHEVSNKDYIVFNFPANIPLNTQCETNNIVSVSFNVYSCRNATKLYDTVGKMHEIFDDYTGTTGNTEIKSYSFSNEFNLIDPTTPNILQMNISYNVYVAPVSA